MIHVMKKLSAAISGAITYLYFAMPAFAQTPIDICPQGDQFKGLCNKNLSFSNVVGFAITVLLIVAVVIAVIFLIWGGIRWILSGGDKSGVESARNHIIGAIVGLIIALAAYFVLRLVLGFFGINVTTFDLPTLKFQ